jgi:hypothetical protein
VARLLATLAQILLTQLFVIRLTWSLPVNPSAATGSAHEFKSRDSLGAFDSR